MIKKLALLGLLLPAIALAGCHARLLGGADKIAPADTAQDADYGLIQMSLGVSGSADIPGAYMGASVGFSVSAIRAEDGKTYRVYGGSLSVGNFIRGETLDAASVPAGTYTSVCIHSGLFSKQFSTNLKVDPVTTARFRLLLNLGLIDDLMKLPPEQQQMLTADVLQTLFMISEFT